MRLFAILASSLAIGIVGFSEPRAVDILGPEGGDIRSLAVHTDRPDTVFLGTSDGQIFVSRNFGDSWEKLMPGLNRRALVIDNFAFHPRDPETLYVATWELKSDRGVLYRTRNGGRSWAEVSLGPYGSAIRAIALAPSDPKAIALGITEGVILSLDEGQTWDRITRGYRSLYHVESLAFDPSDSQALYVGTWRLGWRTSNRGKNWEPMHKGMLFDSDIFSLLVDPSNPSVLYSSACTGIYKSINRGKRWNKLKKGLPKEAKRTRTLRLDPSDGNTIYAGTTVGLFVSTDAGVQWNQLIKGVVVNAVVVNPRDNRLILVGTDDAGILKSQDGGVTFYTNNRGFIHRQVPAIVVAPQQEATYYVSVAYDGEHGGFFVSQDGGDHWKSYNEGLREALTDIKTILPTSLPNSVYLGTSKGVFVGKPGEKSWQRISATRKLAVRALVSLDKDERKLFLATTEGLFCWDSEKDTVKKHILPGYRGPVNTIFCDQSSGQVLVGTDAGLFRSEDQGLTWESEVKGLPSMSVNVLKRSGSRFFCGTQVGLFSSEDSGATWSKCESVYSIAITTLQTNPFSQDEIVVAGSSTGHLFYSQNGGKNWSIKNLGANRSTIVALAFGTSGELLAGTLSEGIYRVRPF